MTHLSADNTAPSKKWKAIVLDTALGVNVRALYIGGAGDVSMTGEDGVTAIFSVLAGQMLPCGPSKVNTTGTTATGLIGIY